MPKITIVGKAIVITSAIKTATIKQLKKFKPEALSHLNDKNEVDFVVGYSAKGTASINKFGVEYNGTNADGFAQATFLCVDDLAAANQKEFVLDTYGAGLLKLDAVEAEIVDIANDLTAAITAVSDDITVA